MNCDTCGSPRPADMRLEIANNHAKNEAIEKKTPMAVYLQENGDYGFIDARIAYANNYRIANVVSQHL